MDWIKKHKGGSAVITWVIVAFVFIATQTSFMGTIKFFIAMGLIVAAIVGLVNLLTTGSVLKTPWHDD